jgi:hypothetical protein
MTRTLTAIIHLLTTFEAALDKTISEASYA